MPKKLDRADNLTELGLLQLGGILHKLLPFNSSYLSLYLLDHLATRLRNIWKAPPSMILASLSETL